TAIPQANIITGAIPAPAGAIAAPAGAAPGGTAQNGAAPRGEPASAAQNGFAAVLAWFDSLDALGFDGRELAEVGLKNGSLSIDDGRNGKRWNFDNINFSLTRPKEGGVAFAITSTGAD